jgi:tetratricopeptide (TPR) repeat protein
MHNYYQTRTSDLSASLTHSSVSESLSNFSSISKRASLENVDLFSSDREHANQVDAVMVSLLSNLFSDGSYIAVIDIAHQLLKDHPESIFVNNLLAESYAKTGKDVDAVKYYKKVINLKPDANENVMKEGYLPNIHNNLAVSLKSLGYLEQSEDSLKQAIALNPNFSSAYNNYGNLLNDRADLNGAQKHFLKAIDIDPDNFSAYWNLHSTVNDFEQARNIIELCLERAPLNHAAAFTLAGINAFAGDSSHFKSLLNSEYANNPILTSIKWILSLPILPEIHFNRWSLFDRAIELSDRTRPFYEFGVWMGDSFRYLMHSFETGYGFDTFEGLPESWGPLPKGSYSSFGTVPNIEGGRFIVGTFDETLPKFFAVNRPKASLINFDADLYASTLSALTNSIPVIDSKTILIFDEFIVNSDWEKDEYRALNEFCQAMSFSYEVLAVSLFTKQVMVRLITEQ